MKTCLQYRDRKSGVNTLAREFVRPYSGGMETRLQKALRRARLTLPAIEEIGGPPEDTLRGWKNRGKIGERETVRRFAATLARHGRRLLRLAALLYAYAATLPEHYRGRKPRQPPT